MTFADAQSDALAFARWNGARQGNLVEPAVCQFDWLQADLAGVFDLLLLADVSYRPVHHAPLRRHTLGSLSPQGVVLHADPMRRESGAFVRWLHENLATMEVQRSTAFLDRRVDVRLCIASRSPEALVPWRDAVGREAR